MNPKTHMKIQAIASMLSILRASLTTPAPPSASKWLHSTISHILIYNIIPDSTTTTQFYPNNVLMASPLESESI